MQLLTTVFVNSSLSFCSYVIGGTITQSLTLAIHELSHNLMFKYDCVVVVVMVWEVLTICEKKIFFTYNRSVSANRYFSYFANLPLVFAYAV
jgi:hypothetical protein